MSVADIRQVSLIQQKNVLILSVALGLAMTGTSIVLTISALVGVTMAPDPALNTLPLGLQG